MDAVRVPKKPRRFTSAESPTPTAPPPTQQPPPPPPPQGFQTQFTTEQGRTIYESIQRTHPNCPPFEVLEAFLIAYILLKSSGCLINPSNIVDMSVLDKPLLMSLIGSKVEIIRLGDIRQSLGIYFHNDFRDCVVDLARLVKCVYDSLIASNVLSPPSTPPPSSASNVPASYPTPPRNAAAPPAPTPATVTPESEGAAVSPSRRVTVKRSPNGKVLIGYKGWGAKRVQPNFDKGTWVATFELDMDEEDDGSVNAEKPDYEKSSMSIRKVEFDGKEWSDTLARSKAEAFEFKMDRGCQANLGPAAPLPTAAKTNLIGADAGARVRAFTRRLKSISEWIPPAETSCCQSCGSMKNCSEPQVGAQDRRSPADPWHYVDLFSRFFT